MTKLEKDAAQLLHLFESQGINVTLPIPRHFRAAARYLERKGLLVAADMSAVPGGTTAVRAYRLASRQREQEARTARAMKARLANKNKPTT